MLRQWVGGPFLCSALSLGLAACSSDVPTKSELIDARVDRATDAADALDNRTGDRTEAPSDRGEVGADAREGGGDAAAGGSGGADASGAGGATSVGGTTGAGGATGVGGTTGIGGATGVGGGNGGTDGGSDADGPVADMGNGGDDAGNTPDAPVDQPQPADGGPDSNVVCGVGCPANVEPQALILWLSADVGVTCDQRTPPRITGWQDRRVGSTVKLTPVAQKVGPRCDGQSLAGVPLPFFDRTTADVDTGILSVDLTPLNQKSYTIFVVERRRVADARYILGTDVPFPANITDCLNDNAHLGYRFGYHFPTVFWAGSYTADAVDESCQDPGVLVPAFTTPQAALEVERLAAQDEHTMSTGGTTNPSTDTDPMDNLLQGYLGRAAQATSSSDSRYLGEVAEVVIYGIALTPSEVTSVSDYLKSRWNL